ncbi:T9SS type A sorting domain-containing protein [bacterium]|nr:T9SS type A sorting domain-containing protein [bacterium]
MRVEKSWLISQVLIALFMASGGLSQSSANYSLKKSVTDQGGGRSSSANHQITGAIGQPGAIDISAGTNYEVLSGFLASGITVTGVEKKETAGIPQKFELYQNYPNPFNPGATIRYQIPEPAEVNLIVFDVMGRRVWSINCGMRPAGSHQVLWDGVDASGNRMASGIYLYKIMAAGKGKHWIAVKKMNLTK